MIKTLTFRCPSCGKTVSYAIGAGPQHASLQAVVKLVSDKRESAKLADACGRIAKQLSETEQYLFCLNRAEPLMTVSYAACDSGCVSLFADGATGLLNEKEQERQAAVRARWDALLRQDGTIAFPALYLDPKTKTLHNGLYLRLRWTEGGKAREYVLPNRSESGATLTLADDNNAGFCHNGCTTAATCAACGVDRLVVDNVSFVKPSTPA